MEKCVWFWIFLLNPTFTVLHQIGGLHPRAIPNKPDGTFDLDVLDESIRPKNNPHEPCTGLIVVENTHNYYGGKVIPIDFLAKVGLSNYRMQSV